MFQLTRGQIITEGLSQAARPDLISNGRLWLNQFLEDMYQNQDWPWLIRLSTLAVVQGGPIPIDYRAAVSVTIGRTVANQQQRVRIVAADEFHERFQRNQTEIGGTPEIIYVDERLRTFNYWPEPVSGLVIDFRYYDCPALPDQTDPGTDALFPVWRATTRILTQAIYVRALEYNDDVRFDKEEKKIFSMLNNHKMNARDLRAGRARLRYGKSFTPRRGRF